MTKRRPIALAAVLALLIAPPALAGPGEKDLVTVSSTGSAIEWRPAVDSVGLTLTVTGPDGFHLRREIAPGEAASFVVFDEHGAARPDGTYRYELRPSLSLDAGARRELEPLRRTGRLARALDDAGLAVERTSQSGSFAIADGALVHDDAGDPEAGVAPGAPLATKATVLTISDGTINDSLCVGFSCSSSPPFGDSTILVQETTVRLKFDDTSTSSFPDNDWELTANDSSSGGIERFSISDCGTGSSASCADDEVFSVEAGARENALYIESDGEVGFGTLNPIADLHVVTGDSPSLRLEQDGSQGFDAQAWEVIGNEVGFLVEDSTSGSFIYPFRIETGAGSHSLVVDTTGAVGLGTHSPAQDLHLIDRGDANANTAIRLSTASHSWDFAVIDSNGNFRVSKDGTGTTELDLTPAGNLTITGQIFTGGSCGSGCDRVFAPDFELESIEEHAAAMWTNSYLPAVGPTPEEGPFNLSAKTLGMLNELEKAHIYIEQLHGTLEEKGREVAELRARVERQGGGVEVAELRARIERLEKLLTAGTE